LSQLYPNLRVQLIEESFGGNRNWLYILGVPGIILFLF